MRLAFESFWSRLVCYYGTSNLVQLPSSENVNIKQTNKQNSPEKKSVAQRNHKQHSRAKWKWHWHYSFFGIISMLLLLITWIIKSTAQLLVKITKFQCYSSIKVHEIYGIHMYFFFPEMLCDSWQLINSPYKPKLGLHELVTSCSHLSECSCHRHGLASLKGGCTEREDV